MAFRRAGTTPDPVHVDRASTLVTTGVYAWTRNPMYVGLTLLLCAWACVLAAPWTAAGPPLFAAYITRFQILPEERALSERFGEAYAAYLRRVRRWI
jgi:protein-S-isoprenylcysteine O-methyltransferase Ste14